MEGMRGQALPLRPLSSVLPHHPKMPSLIPSTYSSVKVKHWDRLYHQPHYCHQVPVWNPLFYTPSNVSRAWEVRPQVGPIPLRVGKMSKVGIPRRFEAGDTLSPILPPWGGDTRRESLPLPKHQVAVNPGIRPAMLQVNMLVFIALQRQGDQWGFTGNSQEITRIHRDSPGITPVHRD